MEGKQMKKVMLVTTTATFANKGADVLRRNGIDSEIRKAAGGTAAGCLFGITVAAKDREAAVRALESSHVRVISLREVQS